MTGHILDEEAIVELATTPATEYVIEARATGAKPSSASLPPPCSGETTPQPPASLGTTWSR